MRRKLLRRLRLGPSFRSKEENLGNRRSFVYAFPAMPFLELVSQINISSIAIIGRSTIPTLFLRPPLFRTFPSITLDLKEVIKLLVEFLRLLNPWEMTRV